MRESDLLAFQIGVRVGQPKAVMCSYNGVNGDYACENKHLLTDILKQRVGLQGLYHFRLGRDSFHGEGLGRGAGPGAAAGKLLRRCA